MDFLCAILKEIKILETSSDDPCKFHQAFALIVISSANLTTTQSQSLPPAPSNTITQSDTEHSSTQLTVSLPDNQPQNEVVPCKAGCLLKATVAIVKSADHQYHARTLFDEGVQRSFITEQLAKYLSITPTKSQMVNTSAFGGDTSS